MSKIVNLKPIFDSLVVEQLESKKKTERELFRIFTSI